MKTGQVAQGFVQLGLENFQGWWLHSFFRALFHCLAISTEKSSPQIPLKPPTSVYICCLLPSCHITEQPGFMFLIRCNFSVPSRECNHFQSTGSALVHTVQDPVRLLYCRDTLLTHDHCDAHEISLWVFCRTVSHPLNPPRDPSFSRAGLCICPCSTP